MDSAQQAPLLIEKAENFYFSESPHLHFLKISITITLSS